jgi:hypothetical protein
MKDPCARISRDIWSLAFEASHVMALRGLALANGRAYAKNEVDRMVDEKAKAFFALQWMFFTGALGFTTPDIAAKSVAHYRKAVPANRRRLLSRATKYQ